MDQYAAEVIAKACSVRLFSSRLTKLDNDLLCKSGVFLTCSYNCTKSVQQSEDIVRVYDGVNSNINPSFFGACLNKNLFLHRFYIGI